MPSAPSLTETWLVPEACRLLTPNRYRQADARVLPVDILLFHYSAGADAPIGPRIVRWNAIPGGASTHLFTSRRPASDPTIQLAPLEDRTWHAGKGAIWRGLRGGVNVRSIGIDVDNLGYLKRKGSGWVYVRGNPAQEYSYRGPAPFVDSHGMGWEPYTDESIREVCRLVRIIADLYPIVRTDSDRLLPHSDVKTSKVDTGPAFPWDEIRSAAGVTYER